MKFVLAIALMVFTIVALAIPKLKKYRSAVIIIFSLASIALSAMQTIKTADLMLPFYHPMQQSFYQKEFMKEGLYPDAFLQLLVRNKTVYTKDDLDDYLANHSKREGDTSWFDDGKYWMYEFYHQKNATAFLEAAGAKVIASDDYNNTVLTEDNLKSFEDCGYVNDLYRNLFLLSDLNDEWSNSFFYYWYYATAIGEKRIYMNPEGLEKETDLVILWDEDETLYVMTKTYYDREVGEDV